MINHAALDRALAPLLALVLVGCGGTASPTPVQATTTAVPLSTTAPTLTPTSIVAIPTQPPLTAPAADSSDILYLPPPPADERIAYGTDVQQFGDLRLPAGPGPYPVVVVLHGGYWLAQYDLGYAGFMAAALTRAGVATWNLEYRRIGNPGGGWPGTFQDVAAGTDFLRTLAPRYKFDLKRVVTMGHSAGGQLALWLAGRARIPSISPLYSADPLALRGAVSLDGVADLQQGWEQQLGNSVVDKLLGGSPAAVADRYAATSPRALLPLGVPQRLLHGTADPIVPYTISVDYADAATAAGDDARLIPLAGAGHFQAVDPRTPEWAKVQDAVLGLLGP